MVCSRRRIAHRPLALIGEQYVLQQVEALTVWINSSST
jgi:hypothetical protein